MQQQQLLLPVRCYGRDDVSLCCLFQSGSVAPLHLNRFTILVPVVASVIEVQLWHTLLSTLFMLIVHLLCVSLRMADILLCAVLCFDDRIRPNAQTSSSSAAPTTPQVLQLRGNS
jgi:hypothetical protein